MLISCKQWYKLDFDAAWQYIYQVCSIDVRVFCTDFLRNSLHLQAKWGCESGRSPCVALSGSYCQPLPCLPNPYPDWIRIRSNMGLSAL